MVKLGVSEAFSILGLPQDVTLDVAKATYRQALRHHPDKGGDTAQFQHISEAYNTVVKHLDRPSRAAPSHGASRHGPHCGCYGDSDEDYYDDDDEEYYEDEDDDIDFFRYLFEEALRNRASRFAHMRFARQKKDDEPKETEEEYKARLRRTREEREAADARRAREEADRKREAEREREREKAAAEKRRTAKKAKKKASATVAKQSAEATAAAIAQRAQATRSAVFAAARAGDSPAVRKGVWEDGVDAAGGEVRYGAEAAIQRPPKDANETLLHIAAAKGDVDLVAWLCDHSAEAEERDARGYTPLHVALEKGHVPVVKHFMDAYPPREDEHSGVYSAPPNISLLTMALGTANPELVWIVLDARLTPGDEIRQAWALVHSAPGKKALTGTSAKKGKTKWDEVVDMLKVYGKLTPPPSP